MFDAAATAQSALADGLDPAALGLAEGVPPDHVALADCVPSGWLALELDTATASAAHLDDGDLVDSIVAFERLSAWALARQARLLAQFARRRPADDSAAERCGRPSLASEFAPDEIGLALRLSRMTATVRLEQAVRLDRELSPTRAAWERGVIDAAKARAIADATARVAPTEASSVQDRVLARAEEQTVSQLRAALARAVIAADPAGAAERHEVARGERRVVLNAESDGMASLWALLPADAAVAGHQHLSRLARNLPADDPRGMDARRADLLVESLTGQLAATSAGPSKPLVQVAVPLTTILGADDQPGELAGYGPIPAALAREVAADGVWRRLITDPMSGTVLDHGRTTYHPPAGLADFVRARDRHCRFPTCRQPATTADLDHIVAFDDGGTTSADNLHAVCRHHHRLKQAPSWAIRSGENGSEVWITPTGRSYTSRPHDYGGSTTEADPDRRRSSRSAAPGASGPEAVAHEVEDEQRGDADDPKVLDPAFVGADELGQQDDDGDPTGDAAGAWEVAVPPPLG